LVEKEKEELEVLCAYLPKQLTEEQAEELVRKVISDLAAESKKDMGRVMKEVLARGEGRIDGKTASATAAKYLK
jgi:hypothetical protein